MEENTYTLSAVRVHNVLPMTVCKILHSSYLMHDSVYHFAFSLGVGRITNIPVSGEQKETLKVSPKASETVLIYYFNVKICQSTHTHFVWSDKKV